MSAEAPPPAPPSPPPPAPGGTASAAESPRPPAWRRVVREGPLLAGLLVAGALLAHRLVHPLGHPAGSDYHQYLASASHIWGDFAEPYWDWRKPLYPYLLGLYGREWGYVLTGTVIARLSAVVAVGSTAAVGRALGGPWAGGLAAVAAAAYEPLAASTTWINSYPLFGALCGLAWAGAALSARWPHPVWAALAGLGGGLAMVVDDRGASVAAPAALVALVCVLAGPGWLRRGLGVAALGLGLAAGRGLDARMQALTHVEARTLDDAILAQREVAALDAGPGAPTCPEPGSVWAAATDACAERTRAGSLTALWRHGELPPGRFVWLLPLVLLPGRWGAPGRRGWRRHLAGLRGSLAAAGMYGGSVAAIWLASGLAPLPDRYLLPYVAPLCSLLPVAALRGGALLRGVPRVGILAPPLAAVLALAALVTTWPRVGEPRRPTDLRAVDARDLVALLGWMRATVGPDDRLYDASRLHLYLADLPARVPHFECPPPGQGGGSQALWPLRIEGTSWLVVRIASDQERARAGSQGWRDDLAAVGWELMEGPPGLSPYTTVWRLDRGKGFTPEEMPADVPASATWVDQGSPKAQTGRKKGEPPRPPPR